MARLACSVLALLLVLISVSESKVRCGHKSMIDRKYGCRTELSMFKRLLEDIQNEDTDQNEDERNIENPTSDEEADLRTLLYGQVPVDTSAATDKRTEKQSSSDLRERELQIRRYELEMKLVDEMLKDLENFNLNK